MVKARVFALSSALMSLAFLACLLAGPIILFVNWRVAIALVPIALVAAFLAKWLNGLKLQTLYGEDLGAKLNELDWTSGRRTNL